MRMVQLVYASTFLKDKGDVSELKKIHEKAMENNAKSDISGMLIFGNNYFLQCLEGGREKVNRIYEKISKDERHNKTLILSYEECHVRKFSNWSMQFLLLTGKKKDIILKHSRSELFNPYEMSGESCINLLLELNQTSAS